MGITVNRTSLLVFIDNVTYWQNQQDLLRICSDSAKHFKTDQTVQIVKWPKAYCKDNLGHCQLNFLKTKLKAKRPTYKQQSKVAYSKGLTETSGSLEPIKVWKTVLIFKIMLVYPNQFEPLKIREGCIKVAVIPENLMQYFCLIAWIQAESLDFNHILILWFRITVPFSKNIWMWVQCNSVQTCINNAQDKNAFTCWSRPYTWTFSPPLCPGSVLVLQFWEASEVASSMQKWNRSSFQIQRRNLREDSMNWCVCMNDFEMMWLFSLSPKVHQSLIIDTKHAVTTTRQRSWYWINSLHEMVFAVKIRVNPLRHTRLHFLTFARSSKKQIYVAKTHQELSTAKNVFLCVSKNDHWITVRYYFILDLGTTKKYSKHKVHLVHALVRFSADLEQVEITLLSSNCRCNVLFVHSRLKTFTFVSSGCENKTLCLNIPVQHMSTAAFFKPLPS